MTTMPKKKPNPPAPKAERHSINAPASLRPLLHMLTGILQTEQRRYVSQPEAIAVAVREAIEARGYDPDEETP